MESMDARDTFRDIGEPGACKSQQNLTNLPEVTHSIVRNGLSLCNDIYD